MIYPTRRTVLLAALGIPVALLLAIMAPKLWLIGGSWVVLVIGLMLLDALLAGRRLKIVPALPNGLAVGQSGQASFALRFDAGAPRDTEVALDIGARMRAQPYRQTVPIDGGRGSAEFALDVVRRGEGRFENLWMRWQGPIGLAWTQRREALDKTIPIVPNVQAVKDEATRLFRRDMPIGAICSSTRPKDRNSTRCAASSPAWTAAPSTGSNRRGTVSCWPRSSRPSRTSTSSWRSTPAD